MTRAAQLRWTIGALACAMASVPAAAQDIIVMRKVIEEHTGLPSKKPTATPTPAPSASDPKNYYSWQVSGWKQQSGTCGSQGLETRDVSCRRTDGTAVADTLCTGNGSGPKPDASQPATITSTCGYVWKTGTFSGETNTCGKATATREVSCERSDGSPAAGSLCPQPAPATSKVVEDYSGCSFGWIAGGWSAPTTTCGTSSQTRTITCERSDGTQADDAACAQSGERPTARQDVSVTTGCATSWRVGSYGTPVPACGPTTQTRTVTCVRGDGTTVTDAECSGERPVSAQPATDYSTCTDGRTPEHPYVWSVGAYGAPSTTCGDATATRSVQCLDDTGAVAPDARCAGPRPDATRATHETSGCTTGWTTGSFGAAQPACGTTVQTRYVACVRSDGVQISDSACDGPRPSSTQTATDYSACTFGWTAGAWTPVSSTCGAATQTRTVSCQRTDGAAAPDSSCSAAERPDETQSSYQTSGCGLSWKTGDWSTPAPACGVSSQTRSVSCLRSDGQDQTDDQCSAVGAKPATEQTVGDYSTCTFSWNVGTYSGGGTTCGTSVRTRSVSCQRSDGTSVGDASCPAPKPGTSETTTQTSGCTYGWVPGSYGAAAPACGTSTRSRTVTCQRSDGTTADQSLCTAAKPATSEPVSDYSTCSYDWNVSSWNGTAGCGSTVTQTRTVSCQRSNLDAVADSYCTTAKPSPTQTITDYSACSYSWKVVNGPWSSTCSQTATRTNTVTCQRQGGVTVADSFCTQAKPATDETQGIYSSCTYTPSFSSTYGVCSATTSGGTSGTQSSPIVSCTRSDGTTVPVSSCQAQTTSRSCTVRYTATYGSPYGTCIPTSQGSASGTETSGISSCRGEDGVTVPTSSCTSSGSASSVSKSCSIVAYTPSYGTCTNGSQTITACQTTGTDSTGSVPTSSCPAGMQTKACTAAKCEAVAGNRWTGRFINGNTSYRTHSMSVSKTADVQAACETMYGLYGIGSCFFSPATDARKNPVFPANVSYYEQYAWTTFANRPDLTAANCGQ